MKTLYADTLTFGESIQAIIDGKKIINRPDRELEKYKRKYRSLKKLEGLGSDPFFFEIDGFRFTSLKCYRGKTRVYLWGNEKKEVGICDLMRVKALGFVRQKKEKSGMVDFYTRDINTKSDRNF